LAEGGGAQRNLQEALDISISQRGRPGAIFFARCLHDLQSVSLVGADIGAGRYDADSAEECPRIVSEAQVAPCSDGRAREIVRC
jgi:hypothetical protein